MWPESGFLSTCAAGCQVAALGGQAAQCCWPRLSSKDSLSSKADQTSEAAGFCLLWKQTFSGRFSMHDPRWCGDF